MTEDERVQLRRLLDQLEAVRLESRDPDADALIRASFAQQPDAAYLLVQRALLQDQALAAAAERIDELQRAGRRPEGAARQQSFLAGNAWGRSAADDAGAADPQGAGARPSPSAHPDAAALQPQGGAAPPANRGGWIDRLRGQPSAGPRPMQAAGPAATAAPMAAAGRGSSFLGNAAATAAGVAGGAFLFQGLSHMLGGRGDAAAGGRDALAGGPVEGDGNLADYRGHDPSGTAAGDSGAATHDQAGWDRPSDDRNDLADAGAYEDAGFDDSGDDFGADAGDAGSFDT